MDYVSRVYIKFKDKEKWEWFLKEFTFNAGGETHSLYEFRSNPMSSYQYFVNGVRISETRLDCEIGADYDIDTLKAFVNMIYSGIKDDAIILSDSYCYGGDLEYCETAFSLGGRINFNFLTDEETEEHMDAAISDVEAWLGSEMDDLNRDEVEFLKQFFDEDEFDPMDDYYRELSSESVEIAAATDEWYDDYEGVNNPIIQIKSEAIASLFNKYSDYLDYLSVGAGIEVKGNVSIFHITSAEPDDLPTSETEVLDYLIAVLSEDEIHSPEDMEDIEDLDLSDELISCLRELFENKDKLYASIEKIFVGYYVENMMEDEEDDDVPEFDFMLVEEFSYIYENGTKRSISAEEGNKYQYEPIA